MPYHYYDYFKSPHDGRFYVCWHEGLVSGIYDPVGTTEEKEAQRLVKILNLAYGVKGH